MRGPYFQKIPEEQNFKNLKFNLEKIKFNIFIALEKIES